MIQIFSSYRRNNKQSSFEQKQIVLQLTKQKLIKEHEVCYQIGKLFLFVKIIL